MGEKQKDVWEQEILYESESNFSLKVFKHIKESVCGVKLLEST